MLWYRPAKRIFFLSFSITLWTTVHIYVIETDPNFDGRSQTASGGLDVISYFIIEFAGYLAVLIGNKSVYPIYVQLNQFFMKVICIDERVWISFMERLKGLQILAKQVETMYKPATKDN